MQRQENEATGYKDLNKIIANLSILSVTDDSTLLVTTFIKQNSAYPYLKLIKSLNMQFLSLSQQTLFAQPHEHSSDSGWVTFDIKSTAHNLSKKKKALEVISNIKKLFNVNPDGEKIIIKNRLSIFNDNSQARKDHAEKKTKTRAESSKRTHCDIATILAVKAIQITNTEIIINVPAGISKEELVEILNTKLAIIGSAIRVNQESSQPQVRLENFLQPILVPGLNLTAERVASLKELLAIDNEKMASLVAAKPVTTTKPIAQPDNNVVALCLNDFLQNNSNLVPSDIEDFNDNLSSTPTP